MRLQVPPGSPWWLVVAADSLLVLHIGGGGIGIVSGFVALLAHRRGRLHRIAGTVFFASMLVMATIGAAVSPFLPVPEMANVAGGIFTIYLLATSWVAIRRRDGAVGVFDHVALATALAIVGAGLLFMRIAAASPTGTIARTPPQAFVVFVVLGAIAAAGDLNVILRGGVSGAARVARHLWRMCTALFVATGSFFLGQQKFLPVALRGSAWLFVPVLVPLLLMLFWLVRVRLPGWYARLAATTQRA